jgi:hypothetical protein
MKLTIPDSYWKPNSDPDIGDARLLCAEPLEINGLAMHLEAWLVEAFEPLTEGGRQTNPYVDEDLRNVWHVFSSGGDAGEHFQTMTINGKQYVVVATPFID